MRAHACRKFTHALQTVSVLAVCIWGSGVDGVDLDKCQAAWTACAPVLLHLLTHASYAKAARSRSAERDIGIEAALHACLSLHRAHASMQNCSEQVRVPDMTRHVPCHADLAESMQACICL